MAPRCNPKDKILAPSSTTASATNTAASATHTAATTQKKEFGCLLLSCAIFICSCYHYFDLCLTSTYSITSVFHPLSSILLLYSMIFQTLCLSIFHLPFSVCTSIPHCLLLLICVRLCGWCNVVKITAEMLNARSGV